MPKKWQHFIVSLVAQFALPLLPLLLEYWITGKVTDQTLTIIASTYSIAIGLSSKEPVVLFLGTLSGSAFTALFGIALLGMKPAFSVALPSLLTICMFTACLITERYFRHVKQLEVFFEVSKS